MMSNTRKSKTRIKNKASNMKMTWDMWAKINQTNRVDELFSQENAGESLTSIWNKKYNTLLEKIIDKIHQNESNASVAVAADVGGGETEQESSKLKPNLYGVEKVLSFDELSELGEPEYQIELNGTRLRIPSSSKKASGGSDSLFKAISYAMYNRISAKKVKGQIFHSISHNWKTWESKIISQNPKLFSSKRGRRAFRKYEIYGCKIPSEVELEVAAEFYQFDFGLVTIVPSGHDGELALQVKNWSGNSDSDHPRPRYYFLRTDCYIGESKTHQFVCSWQFLEPIKPEPKFRMDKPKIPDGFFPLSTCFRKVIKVKPGQERNHFNPEYYRKKQIEKPFKNFRDHLADKMLPTCLAFKGKTYLCQELSLVLDEVPPLYNNNGISSILSNVLFKNGTLLSEEDINEIIKLGKVHYYSYLTSGREPSDPFQIPGMTRSSLRKFFEEYTDDSISDLKVAAGIFYFSFIVMGLDGEGNVFTSENQHSSPEVVKYKRMYYSSQQNIGGGKSGGPRSIYTDSDEINDGSDDEWTDLGQNEIEFENKKAHQKELEDKLKQLRNCENQSNYPTLVFLQKYAKNSSNQMKWIYMKEVDFNCDQLSHKIHQKMITRPRNLTYNQQQVDEDEIEMMNEVKEYKNIMANVTMIAVRNEKGEIQNFGPKLSDFDGYGRRLKTPQVVKRNLTRSMAKFLMKKELNYTSGSYHSRSRKYEFAKARNESDEVNEKNFNWFVDILYERVFMRLANFFRKLGRRLRKFKNKGKSRVFPTGESGVTEMLQEDFQKVHSRIHKNIKAKAKMSQLSEAETETIPELVLVENASSKKVSVKMKPSKESLDRGKVRVEFEMKDKVQGELRSKPKPEFDFESIDEANSTSYLNLSLLDLHENNDILKKETTQRERQELSEQHERTEPIIY